MTPCGKGTRSSLLDLGSLNHQIYETYVLELYIHLNPIHFTKIATLTSSPNFIAIIYLDAFESKEYVYGAIFQYEDNQFQFQQVKNAFENTA